MRQILTFMLQLLFGNIFQLLYNMENMARAGKFVSNDAFVAVDDVDPYSSCFVLSKSLTKLRVPGDLKTPLYFLILSIMLYVYVLRILQGKWKKETLN